jgi:hypothetical protein
LAAQALPINKVASKIIKEGERYMQRQWKCGNQIIVLIILLLLLCAPLASAQNTSAQNTSAQNNSQLNNQPPTAVNEKHHHDWDDIRLLLITIIEIKKDEIRWKHQTTIETRTGIWYAGDSLKTSPQGLKSSRIKAGNDYIGIYCGHCNCVIWLYESL